MTTSLLLCHTSVHPQQVLRRLRNDGESGKWLFLCQSYVELLKWEDALSPEFTRIPIGDDLARVADLLRQPFLELLTDLGRQFDSLAWWTSRVSERNTMVSPLFLYCCYLQIGLERIEATSGTLCVISESLAVLQSLEQAAETLGQRPQRISRPGSRWYLWLIGHGRIARRALSFLLRRFSISCALLGLRKKYGERPPAADNQSSILLRTFVEDSCFGENKVFHERYFPGLCAWLEQQGYRVWTVPVLYSLNRSYRSAWKWLYSAQQRFLNPDEFYRLPDYLFALSVGWKQTRIPRGQITLGTTDVTRLFDEDKLRFAFDASLLDWALAFRLPHRLKQSAFKADILIAEFENLIPEKATILGLRRYMPNVKIVGFQHGALYPLLLCNFVTKGEASFAPIPDRVVCNGKIFQDILVREGLGRERAVIGAALRYAHLNQDVSAHRGDQEDKPIVLVALPLVVDSCAELLLKVVHALGQIDSVNVLLKPHPMMTSGTLHDVLQISNPPSHFQVINGGMAEWLARARLVISVGSSSLHEALAAGVPVLVVGRETALDLNPLSWFEDMDRTFFTPEHIREEALRLLNLSSDELSDYRERARNIMRDSFEPVTDQTMHAFVDDLIKQGEASVS